MNHNFAEARAWADEDAKYRAARVKPASLFAQYISEREHKNIIEDEKGFLTYQIIAPNTCYVEDVFVKEEYRREGHAKVMMRKLEEIAKSFGCTSILTSVKPSAFGSTESLKVILSDGFQLLRSGNDAIIFTREI